VPQGGSKAAAAPANWQQLNCAAPLLTAASKPPIGSESSLRHGGYQCFIFRKYRPPGSSSHLLCANYREISVLLGDSHENHRLANSANDNVSGVSFNQRGINAAA